MQFRTKKKLHTISAMTVPLKRSATKKFLHSNPQTRQSRSATLLTCNAYFKPLQLLITRKRGSLRYHLIPPLKISHAAPAPGNKKRKAKKNTEMSPFSQRFLHKHFPHSCSLSLVPILEQINAASWVTTVTNTEEPNVNYCQCL